MLQLAIDIINSGENIQTHIRIHTNAHTLSLVSVWVGPSPIPSPTPSLLVVTAWLLRETLEYLLLDVLEHFRIALLHVSSCLRHARPEGVWSDMARMNACGAHVEHMWYIYMHSITTCTGSLQDTYTHIISGGTSEMLVGMTPRDII